MLLPAAATPSPSPTAGASTGTHNPAWLDGLTNYLDPNHFWGAVGLGVVFILIGFMLSWVIRRVIKTLVDHDPSERIDRMTISFMQHLGTFIMWIVLALLFSHLVPSLNKLTTSLLAGVSIMSVVIGFAAQSTLGNLVSGISLVIYKPFRRGDRLQLSTPTGLETGIVEDLSLGYTVLRTFDNRRIVLSNGTIANQIMINLSSVDLRVMISPTISIGYDSDIDKARAIVLDLAKAHSDVIEVVGCPVVNLGGSSVDLSLRAWCSDAATAKGVEHDLLEQVKKHFDEAGIEIPYAYQNVVLSGALDAGKD
ncbi:mechanosensitive ion channel family protein [Qipengyuania gelatinilytica]|uniref:Small-conductance mechanosensitive channel n=1 Tax=Qipengyuania gelatinilytica TaxID=2867231 RepID=A0ABX9A885_9SPHN|nr:mechanosensitive ion channel family protein [Qipengyuania gelatinilytica]QZD96514.1 mechanosensitive ion channel family protein [Qipengyuania gelatinilytica]